VTTTRDPVSGLADVVVSFSKVMGRLECPGRPGGFSLAACDPSEQIHHAEIKGSTVILKTQVPFDQVGSSKVSYGAGTIPYCNVTDSKGRPLPVFGPVIVGKYRAFTPLIVNMMVSKLLPSAGKLGGLLLPANMDELEFKPRVFGGFCDLHAELGGRAPEDLLVYYSCRFECTEPMKLAVLLGYDGPAKMWIDGRELLHDPDGVNPASMDKARVVIKATAGVHNILVALGSNNGKAWGIHLRLERLDLVAAARKRNGFADLALPRVLA
jgi:sialate O-acetylesterase